MSILLVDSYDSFTFNLKTLIQEASGADVLTIYNDSYSIPQDKAHLDRLLSSVDAVVIGPGPGNPSNPKDIGIIPYIFSRSDIPILGVCLGFQCLCLGNGSTYRYLEEPVHGQSHSIEVINHDDLFRGFDSHFYSVRYHSISIDTLNNNSLEPLAYYTHPDEESILMAVKHKSYPHYGVQYHPESICSSNGKLLLQNFWDLAKTHGKPTNRTLLQKSVVCQESSHLVQFEPLLPHLNLSSELQIQFREICDHNSFDIVDACDLIRDLNQGRDDFVLLNSASVPGTWSILGLPIIGETDIITHSTELPNIVHLDSWGGNNSESTQHIEIASIWEYLASYMSDKLSVDTKIDDPVLSECPFIGGLIGLLSYEEGQHIVHSGLEKLTNGNIPDTKLCYITRFIAMEKNFNKRYIVSIKPNDSAWLNEMHSYLSKNQSVDSCGKKVKTLKSVSEQLQNDDKIVITKPNKEDYTKNFNLCQDYLRLGDSYELCLTRHTTIEIPDYITPWNIYKNTVSKNPSPYSMYMNFGDLKLVSTSPERFISWDNEKAQMRPIKGTVRKTEDITFAKATDILKTPKELGENLMIVDLIRHDLSQFLDPVKVSQLMGVEEYKTVYQLVSVIDGYFPKKSGGSSFSGVDLLRHTLPPGSMTGAPKKRSVEILHKLENNKRRGVYSGVCGYWSVNNKSDWSVIIRSFFNYTDDVESHEGHTVWRCGAGGAITVLSDCEGEWVEMCTKLDSVLQIFD